MGIKVIGLFGLPGSGKSSLSRNLSDNYNLILKETVINSEFAKLNIEFTKESFDTFLYSQFKANRNYLIERMLELVSPEKINVLDAITTPFEANYVSSQEDLDFFLVGIWASQEDRIKRIVETKRIQNIDFDEPNTREDFFKLDNRVAKYFCENDQNLFQMANHIIPNNSSFEELQETFYSITK